MLLLVDGGLLKGSSLKLYLSVVIELGMSLVIVELLKIVKLHLLFYGTADHLQWTRYWASLISGEGALLTTVLNLEFHLHLHFQFLYKESSHIRYSNLCQCFLNPLKQLLCTCALNQVVNSGSVFKLDR